MTYTSTDENYTRDGVVCYKESPTAKVVNNDACFFAYTGSTNDGLYRESFENENAISLTFSFEKWGHGSPYREEIPLPRPVSNWKMLFYTFPPEAIQPHLSDFSIEGARAHWMTDFYSTNLGLIVTQRARAVIDEIDPGMHYFFPVKITIRETGELLPANRFYWKPRRVFNFKPRSPSEVLGHGDTPFAIGSAFWDSQTAWELQNTTNLRKFLATLPFWILEDNQFNFGMRPDVFARLKSEFFTGLIEILGDDRNDPDFDRNANMGHF